MSESEIRSIVLGALASVAPEIDPAAVRPGESLRDQLDLDSFDFLRVITSLHDRLGVDIPEADYGKLTTLDQTVAYLSKRLKLGASPTGAAPRET